MRNQVVVKSPLKNLANQTKRFCIMEVKRDGLQLEHVKHPCFDIYLAAVQQNGMALQYVPEADQDLEICLAAMRQNSNAFCFIAEHLKTPEICKLYPK